MSQPIPCPECDGSGKCQQCDGLGVIIFRPGSGEQQCLHCYDSDDYPACEGRCPCCGGTGICFD